MPGRRALPVRRCAVVYPWPFAYDQPRGAEILRVPLSMYLISALIGKLIGIHAAEIAMLLLMNTDGKG